MFFIVKVKVAQLFVSDSFRPHGLHSPWNSPGQYTGMGSLSLLQGISPTQESNPGSSAVQVDSLPAEPPGKPCSSIVTVPTHMPPAV